MDFVVTFKGIRCFAGSFAEAFKYINLRWGSLNRAAEFDVRLIPTPHRLAA